MHRHEVIEETKSKEIQIDLREWRAGEHKKIINKNLDREGT